MFEEFYKSDLDRLSAINNERTVFLNLLYKIKNDTNVKEFLNLLDPFYFEKEMSWNDSYNLKTNLPFYNKLFKNLFHVMIESKSLSDVPVEKIAKKCDQFPDSNGELFMYFFSYIPLITLLNEKVSYEKYIESYIDPNEKMMGETYSEYQKDNLFNKESFTYYRRRYSDVKPKDEDIIDLKLSCEHINFVKNEYETFRKQEIIQGIDVYFNAINHLKEIFNNEKNPEYTARVKFGMQFWEQTSNEKKASKKEFQDSLATIFNALIDKNKEKAS